MTRYIAFADFRLDGKPVDRPGTYDKLLRRLEDRAGEHVTNWLASSPSVAVVTITGTDEKNRLVLGNPRLLVGAATRYPERARWARLSRTCFPRVGDSILIAIPAHSPKTLKIPVCPDKLRLAPGQLTPYGVSLKKLPQVLQPNGDTMTFQHIHGVTESATRDR